MRNDHLARQQSGRGHDLAGLAIAALDDFKIKPCFLNISACRRIPEGLDRGDRRRTNAVDARNAGADGISIHMNRACPTECDAAAELGAGQAEHVAQHLQERGVTVDIGGVIYTIDFDRIRHGCLPDVGSTT